MGNYSGYAASIRSKSSSLATVASSINSLNLGGGWKGAAAQSLVTALESVVSKINSEKGNLESFASTIAQIDEIIAIDEKIKKLEAELGGLDPEDEEQADRIGAIQTELTQLRERRKVLVAQITGALGGFGSTSSDFSMLSISAADWATLCEMVTKFSALPAGNIFKALTKYDANGNVTRDGKEYFDSVIKSVKQKYTGTERNYYVSKAIIDLSLEAGVRIPYVHAGTGATGKTEDTRVAVPTSTFDRGIDCNAFASYVIFDENSTTKWLAVGQFKSAGEAVSSYELAQAGDVFANGKHVGMIVANNPETGEAIILHASGTEVDMRLQKVNYNYFINNGHQIRRVDSTYVSPNLSNLLNIPATNDTTQNNTAIPVVNLNNNSDGLTTNLNMNSNTYASSYAIGTENLNGDLYNGKSLTAPQGLNINGPTGSETWYDLPMSGVVNNMEKLYGYTDVEASIRDDGVKVLSGVTPDGERFENLVMVAADVKHMSNPDGTFDRGEIVETSLGTGIVVDYCERSVNERKADGNVHFDIATAWGTGEYKEAAYAKKDTITL